jgi:hypothetical protein
MEEVVGIIVEDRKRGSLAFLTWGRAYDKVNSEPLVRALKEGLAKFGISEKASIHVCQSLAEVASAEYFYEGILAVAQNPVPYGQQSYPEWKRKMRVAIRSGKQIYLLGKIRRRKKK